MDETLCSLVSPCIEVCRSRWPEQNWCLPKYGRYAQWFNDHLTQEQREEIYDVVKTEEFYMSLPPVLSPSHTGTSIEDLSRVCWERYERVKVITARIGFCPDPEATTREYLRKHKFVDVDNLEIVAIDGTTSKLHHVKGPALFVDDSVTVADDVSRSRNHNMLMINQPWNDGYAKNGSVRVIPSRRMVESINSFADSYVKL